MRVIQGGDGPGFLLKTGRVATLQLLDGHHAIEPCVAGPPHLAHAPRADQRIDLVGTELLTPRKKAYVGLSHV